MSLRDLLKNLEYKKMGILLYSQMTFSIDRSINGKVTEQKLKKEKQVKVCTYFDSLMPKQKQ